MTMRLSATITGLLLLAPGAVAGSGFEVTGAIDFSGGTVEGGLGSALTFDGEPNLVPASGDRPAGIWTGNDDQTGLAIASPDYSSVATVAFVPGSAGWTDGQFVGVYFNENGDPIPSGRVDVFDQDDWPAVLLANFAPGVTDIHFDTAYVEIDGTSYRFDGYGFDIAFNSEPSGYVMAMTTDPSNGSTKLWVARTPFPSPGGIGAFALAGIAAIRRRR